MNITPEEIANAIADILEGAEGQGVVITDKRLAESNSDSLRLLKSQADNDLWKGWEVSWTSIASQVQEGGCDVLVIYVFSLVFYHLYLNDFTNEITSEISFQRAIYAANEALNNNTDLGLGLGDKVLHQFLESSEDFSIAPIGGGSVNEESHVAPFTLRVLVRNTY